ncbi:MAG: mechanosensitive ion channel [Burkholderiales bacterium]|nr:mechanosensitive ion channel [Burkholderiales bacterium]
MDNQTNVGSTLMSGILGVVDHVVSFLPSILGAIALLIIGWLARLLRIVTWRAARLLDKLISHLIGPQAERLRVGAASRVLGTIVFWVVLLFFVTAATEVLGLAPFTYWLSRFVAYLPTLAAGTLIMVAGYALSRIVADLVRTTARGFSPAQRATLARVAQFTIIAAALLVGADQIGVKVTFLVIFIGAVAAAVVGGVALAVGLGARDYIANLIGAHYLREAVSLGQILRVGSIEGRVVDVTATALIMETGDGRVSVPARIYNEQAITVIKSEASG